MLFCRNIRQSLQLDQSPAEPAHRHSMSTQLTGHRGPDWPSARTDIAALYKLGARDERLTLRHKGESVQDNTCPRCQQHLDEKRRQASPVVCDSCGFVFSSSDEELRSAVEKRLSTLNLEIAMAIIVAFIGLAIWDQHPVSITYLTAKDFIGLATSQNRQDLANQCLTAGMYGCTERMYQKLGKTDVEYQVKLGRLQFGRGEYKEAAETFHNYFQKGGKDLDASYFYARTLGELGQVDSATFYFNRTLNARPGILQITVVEDYLRVLARAGRTVEARKLIQRVSHEDRNVAHELEAEFNRIRSSADKKG